MGIRFKAPIWVMIITGIILFPGLILMYNGNENGFKILGIAFL
jgi:hypothetical protein